MIVTVSIKLTEAHGSRGVTQEVELPSDFRASFNSAVESLRKRIEDDVYGPLVTATAPGTARPIETVLEGIYT